MKLWQQAKICSGASVMVENFKTGDKGFRSVRFVAGGAQQYGPVFDHPSCNSDRPDCRVIASESEAESETT